MSGLLTMKAAIVLVGAFAGGFVTGLAGFGTGLMALGVWLYALQPSVASSLVVICSVLSLLSLQPLLGHYGIELMRLTANSVVV